MVAAIQEIRIYVEGGGDSSDGKALIGQGFSQFLEPLRQRARQKKVRWAVIACGGRNAALKAFRTALKQHQHAFNVLLVDAEGPVQAGEPWAHLAARDGWLRPDGADNEHCHLMAQEVEAWLIADPDALESYYGQGFARSSLPARNDVEAIPKDTLVPALERATKQTRKGTYHKIKHCSELLGRLNSAVVRAKAPHCQRLFDVLSARL